MLRMSEKYLNHSLLHSIEEEIVKQAVKTKSIYQFDDKVRAKNYGYNSNHNFYKDTSSTINLHNISVPLLVMNSEDDMISRVNNIPLHDILDNEFCTLIVA